MLCGIVFLSRSVCGLDLGLTRGEEHLHSTEFVDVLEGLGYAVLQDVLLGSLPPLCSFGSSRALYFKHVNHLCVFSCVFCVSWKIF